MKQPENSEPARNACLVLPHAMLKRHAAICKCPETIIARRLKPSK
jgi:hypothetical protein